MNFNKCDNKTSVRPEVLILASRYDISCDYVISKLHKSKIDYFRINREDLTSFSISLDPVKPKLDIAANGTKVTISLSDLNSIWYRRPVFIRETNLQNFSPQQLFERMQWMEFTRGFMVFGDCKWMNHPVATYRAENKIVQLNAANKIGFRIPKTIITNAINSISENYADYRMLVIKGLDTVHIKKADSDIFGYTTIVNKNEFEDSVISTAPIIAQEFLEQKLDLRVTVVSDELFCAAVKNFGKFVYGDWRLHKDTVTFEDFSLPTSVKKHCIELTKSLGLNFGAIDLALQDNEYYFLEINPTGEWGWLVDKVGFPIDESIFRFLTC